MKKLFTAAGLSILFITAAPALAAPSDTACPVEDCWLESTTCDNETAEKVSIHFTNRYKCHLLGICTDFLV